MKRGTTTAGRKGRRRRVASLRIEYTKDSSTNYYTATAPPPSTDSPSPLPDRVYLDRPRRSDIARNCQLMLSHSSQGGMISGLRRQRNGSYRGNVLVYDPSTRQRSPRDLVATLKGDTLTLTLFA